MKDFQSHIIRKNHRCARPRHIIYFDTETKACRKGSEEHHTMDIAWSCYARRQKDGTYNKGDWKFWNDNIEMLKYFLSKASNKTILYLFAHNVFFDLQASGAFRFLAQQKWVLDFYYDKGLVYILNIHKGKRRIKAISTTNFFATSVKNLGKMVELPKLKVDFNNVSRETLSIYCKRDVEIIKAAMEKHLRFIDLHDMGNFSTTKASQAMNAFRHRFMDTKIYPHKDEEVQDLERLAYYGGRVEACEVGKLDHGPFVSLDVNSMYPTVMLSEKFPVRLIDYRENPAQDIIEGCLKKFSVVGEVEIETDEPAYAYRDGKKIVFPIGTFTTYLCTAGMKYAYRHEHIRKVKRLAVYEQAPVFVRYIEYFYALKQKYSEEGDQIMLRLTKDYLNSLYGKFAQRAPLIDEEEDVEEDGYYREEVLDLVTGKTETVTQLLHKRIIVWGDELAKNSFIAISAHITEYARFLLWRMMKKVGYEKVLYSDTDSLKIRLVDLPRIEDEIDQHRLGALKNEGIFNTFFIFGPKDYRTENYIRCKGIPSSAKEIAPGKYKYQEFTGQSSHLRMHNDATFVVRDRIKTLKRCYDKGYVWQNKYVTPFCYANDVVVPQDRLLPVCADTGLEDQAK